MSEENPFPPMRVELGRPNIARVYDWYLGGSTNWAIDRRFGQRVLRETPLVRAMAMSNRRFLHRVVRRLSKLGIDQFVDVGAGVPSPGNTHAIADEVDPGSRVVYIDHEPVAVAHLRMLLEEHGDLERHAVLQADLRDPGGLWKQVVGSGVLDPTRPIALLFLAVLHIRQEGPDGTDLTPQALHHYRELLPAGSYLAISHATDDGIGEPTREGVTKVKQMYDDWASKLTWRSKEETAALFGDFELLDPGMTWTSLWHPEDDAPSSPKVDFTDPSDSGCWAGVGRKT
ncbi:SAM-dependent methyltransferase [Saccharopolyspora halophila]|uniref:SAM-dependent methyltransferase n=1 Tax=Saccharopolyspora halophila TaxID=405551 RepID=A0ABN3GSA6_9PSEU